MATQKITVEIQPTPALEQMFQRVIKEAADRLTQLMRSDNLPALPEAADLEPVYFYRSRTEVQRVLFLDENGQPHWPLTTNVDVAVAQGWRQAFVKKVVR